MKTIAVLCCAICYSLCTVAQVTQINSNKSLHVKFPLSNTKTILVSANDSTLWVTDATLPGTVILSSLIKYEEWSAYLSGKLVFRGRTDATGSELYSTDGTPGGTVILKDIYPGTTGSRPSELITMGANIYFNATTAAEGRELWKTDGSPGGTAIVKDIVPGTDSSNRENQYELFTNGTYLLFAANTAGSGVELWKSDGSPGGTNMLKEINTNNTNADSSNPHRFHKLNSLVLFAAKDATHGVEIWKTDGTPGGTVILKDINTGMANGTSVEIIPGFEIQVFQAFHNFNNKAYFNATDGTSTGQVWSTDGNPLNTSLLKDVVPGMSFSTVSVVQAVNLPAKFIFPVSDGSSSELWESNGTPAGTIPLYTFDPVTPLPPFIYIPYDFPGSGGTNPLFQGNKFFFTAGTMVEGNELWVSDGTFAGTHIVKDINAGSGDGINIGTGFSYLYTSNLLFFKGTTTGQGDELWKTDGTTIGTAIVADIYTGTGSADPELPFFICNGNKVMFSASNGDDPVETDLYIVDGAFGPIPVKLNAFTVQLKATDALLKWNTEQEVNSRDFIVQRSYDAIHFENTGTVPAAGNSANRRDYLFLDKAIAFCGKEIVYYRLMSSDMDGRYELSPVLGLKLQNGKEWNVQLLNNPVQHELNMLCTGTTGAVKLSVRDITGKKVYSNTIQNFNGQMAISLNIQPGIYVLVAEYNNEIKTVRFVKQ